MKAHVLKNGFFVFELIFERVTTMIKKILVFTKLGLIRVFNMLLYIFVLGINENNMNTEIQKRENEKRLKGLMNGGG